VKYVRLPEALTELTEARDIFEIAEIRCKKVSSDQVERNIQVKTELQIMRA